MDERREADYLRKETEEAEISQRKRRLTPGQRDAFIDEYNAGFLTPEERDRFVQEYNADPKRMRKMQPPRMIAAEWKRN
jgi:hypothetical protein